MRMGRALDEQRRACLAPSLEEIAVRSYQVVFAPTFHPSVVITLYDFGDHGDLSVHACTPERRTWRETKTIVGMQLSALRAKIETELAAEGEGEDDEEGRDGILLEVGWRKGQDASVARRYGWSPAAGTSFERLCVAVIDAAEQTLKLRESRAAVAPLRGYFR